MKLNVGGHHFDVAMTTLTAREGFLKQIAENPRGVGCDADGRIFLDRDGELFRYVLEYLRCGVIHPSLEFSDWGMLRNEFMFYFGNTFQEFYVLGETPPTQNHTPIKIPEAPLSPHSLSPSPARTIDLRQYDKCFKCGGQLILPTTTVSKITMNSCDLCGRPKSGIHDQRLLSCSVCNMCICQSCSQKNPQLRNVAVSKMKESERTSVSSLLACIKQQVNIYASEGEGYIGFMHKHYNKLPLNTCKWCIWGGNWTSLRSGQIAESLMEDGFDVLIPGQVSLAKLKTTFTCRLSDDGEPFLTKSNKIRTLKGGFVVAWLRHAVTVSLDSHQDVQPEFASDDLRDYVYGNITHDYKQFLDLMSMSPERQLRSPRENRTRDTSII